MVDTSIRTKSYRAIRVIGMRTAIERSLNLTEPGEFYTDASADWNGAGACRASHISQDGLLSTNSHPNSCNDVNVPSDGKKYEEQREKKRMSMTIAAYSFTINSVK